MRRISIVPLIAVGLTIGGVSSAQEEVSPDGVEVVSLYVNADGNGILRYEDPAGGSEEYVAASGGLSNSTVRPFEVFGALGGPWTGPKVAVCIEGLREDRTMNGALAFELYSNTRQKAVMRYRPVFGTDKAEEIVTIGEGAGPGECSRRYAP